jgi:hypothetical protein
MIGAVAIAAAIIGIAAVGALIRRRLVIRARVARRLAPTADPIAERLFRLHRTQVVTTIAGKADAA